MVSGPTLFRADSSYGNVVLVSEPVIHKTLHDLSVSGREPRGAIEVGIKIGDFEIYFVVTHLGLSWWERRRQAKRLIEIIRSQPAHRPLVLMGDFNEWNRRRPWYREIEKLMGRSSSPRTFPARTPILPLDRIWVRPHQLVIKLTSHLTPLARVASDHLPVKARLQRTVMLEDHG
jgi:endonuclease/exonuclease/phosphatase family metal-dependent hydrolase